MSWTTRDEPDPNAGGAGERYHCTECPWTGRGGLQAFDHHRETGHTLSLANGVQPRFACCAEHSHHLRRVAR